MSGFDKQPMALALAPPFQSTAGLKLSTKLLEEQSCGSLQLVACPRIHFAKDIDITTCATSTCTMTLAQSFVAAALLRGLTKTSLSALYL